MFSVGTMCSTSVAITPTFEGDKAIRLYDRIAIPLNDDLPPDNYLYQLNLDLKRVNNNFYERYSVNAGLPLRLRLMDFNERVGGTWRKVKLDDCFLEGNKYNTQFRQGVREITEDGFKQRAEFVEEREI